ncbi:hypothetical protein ECANGB1_731 [Enterospora canceri]|uniref:Uncharacterized protein n=1 Tax=Enterospora canceri TaxID=1081671 RepID=A0A1Y1S7G4_9MICR|nr:hypothetical protein ECANGB1_731 [Enterospora canceri]
MFYKKFYNKKQSKRPNIGKGSLIDSMECVSNDVTCLTNKLRNITNINPENCSFKSLPLSNASNIKTDNIIPLETVYDRQNTEIKVEPEDQMNVEYYVSVLRNIPGFIENIDVEHKSVLKKYKNTANEFNLQLKHINLLKTNIEKYQKRIAELENVNCATSHKINLMEHELDTLRIYKNEIDPYVTLLKTTVEHKTNENKRITTELTQSKTKTNKLIVENNMHKDDKHTIATIKNNNYMIKTQIGQLLEDIEPDFNKVKEMIKQTMVKEKKRKTDNQSRKQKFKSIYNNLISNIDYITTEFNQVKYAINMYGKTIREENNKNNITLKDRIKELERKYKNKLNEVSKRNRKIRKFNEKGIYAISTVKQEISNLSSTIRHIISQISNIDSSVIHNRYKTQIREIEQKHQNEINSFIEQRRQFEAQKKIYERTIRELVEKSKTEDEKHLYI